MEQLIRILVVPTIPLGYNGITNVILSYCSNINSNHFQFDFIISCGAMEWVREIIKSVRGKIYDLPSRKKNPFLYMQMLKTIIQNNEYEIVHVHGNSGTMAIDIHAAKLGGAKIRIAHCHNSTNKYKLTHKVLKPIMNREATHFLACSDLAGKWAFSQPYTVLKNGIDVKKFIYNEKIRKEYREKLGIADNFVIGHIGHMSYQKNHEFLISVFYEIYKVNNKAKLLLIGDGKNRPLIENQILKLSLENAVIMLGKRNDVNYILQAMDVFVLPSRYEGLGIVNIEAQAAALKCVVADTIPAEAKITDNIEFLSLNSPKELWRDTILKYIDGYERENMYEQIRGKGYDIQDVVKKLEKIYLGQ